MAAAAAPVWFLDPQAVTDYTWDWVNEMGPAVTISSHTVTPSTGLAVSATSVVGSKITARISVTTAPVGSTATATCHVTLSDGQQFDQTFTFRIRNN